MKSYAHIVSKINSTPWLMTEDGINRVLSILERHMFDDEDEIGRHIDLLGLDDDAEASGPQIINGVGVLNLEGPVFPKANLMTELSGATSLETFRNDFRTLLSDSSVHSILLNVDSPGGVSDLVMETAREIREARDVKPVVSIANTMAASAAFWLASQASEFYITDSGLTGSLGVYTVHLDDSEQLKNRGITKTVIKAGKSKAAGEEPLNDSTKANLQASVDYLYEDFINEVAKGRNLDSDFVRSNFGEGGIVTPRDALEVGMVDGIKTYDSLLGELSMNGGVVGNASAVSAMRALYNKGMISGAELRSWTSNSANYMFEPDKEHADPGSQGEPIPREPQMQDDPAVTGGWRVPSDAQPTFPVQQDQPPPVQKGVRKSGVTKTSSVTRKGSAMDRTNLVALATQLGLVATEEATEEELFAAITSEISDVITPLNEAVAAAEARRSFANDYPEEYNKFRELLERDEEHEARTFASRWERFGIEEGETVKKSTQGFAARVLSNIEDVHLKLARKQLAEDDIVTLLDSIAQTGSVDYSEKGSAVTRSSDRTSIQDFSIKEIRDTFAQEVKSVMEEDGVDRRVATKLVAERNPELAEAYKTGHVRR